MKNPLIVAVTSAIAAAGLLAATAQSQGRTAANTDPTRVPAGTYDVDPGHTQVGWRLSHVGFSNYAGGFSDVSGTLTLDPRDVAATKLSIAIPVASVATTSAKLTEEIRSDMFLDEARFPTMRFVSTRVTSTGRGRARMTGDLTLHGVTRPVTLDVRLVGSGVNPLNKRYTVGFDATGTIRRSDFGVKTYLPIIGDDMALTIAGAFEKRG